MIFSVDESIALELNSQYNSSIGLFVNATEELYALNATLVPFEISTKQLDYSIVLKCVVVTGSIGCLANGFVFFLLISDKHLRTCSSLFLIKSQICLDFVSCLILVISDALKLVLNGDGRIMKKWGGIICTLFIGDGLIYTVLYSTTTNLGLIAFERYMKIVHAVTHLKYFRKWVVWHKTIEFWILKQDWFTIVWIHIRYSFWQWFYVFSSLHPVSEHAVIGSEFLTKGKYFCCQQKWTRAQSPSANTQECRRFLQLSYKPVMIGIFSFLFYLFSNIFIIYSQFVKSVHICFDDIIDSSVRQVGIGGGAGGRAPGAPAPNQEVGDTNRFVPPWLERHISSNLELNSMVFETFHICRNKKPQQCLKKISPVAPGL